MDPTHQRRASEREQRRLAFFYNYSNRYHVLIRFVLSLLRLKRKRSTNASATDAKCIEKIEDLSSDDEYEETNSEVYQVEFEQKKLEILTELNQQLESDVIEDFYKFDLIKQRFEKWKKLNVQSYMNAYISLSLPKLFSPLIRYEIIDWNPLQVTQLFTKLY